MDVRSIPSNCGNHLTFGGHNRFPVWSSDGGWIAFQSDREGDKAIFWQPADGRGLAERLTKPTKGLSHLPESWSPNGDTFLFDESDGSYVSLWSFSLRDRKATAFGTVRSEGFATNAVFSPDGRWVAYQEINGTRTEVYVQPFPPTGERYQLPVRRGNHHPLWSRDGKELFYVPGPGEFVAISVSTTPSFLFGNPIPIQGNLVNL